MVRTVFVLLEGQGAALTIDPHRFYRLLHSAVSQFSKSSPQPEIAIPAIIETLDAALLKRRRSLTKSTISAFVRLLPHMANQVPSSAAAAYLLVTKSLVQAHDWASGLLTDDEDSPPVGVMGAAMNAEFEAAGKAVPHASTSLTTLGETDCDEVRRLAKHLGAGCPPQGPLSLPAHIGKCAPLELFHQLRRHEIMTS